MSIKLPIVISAEQAVSEHYQLTSGMLEKLEAWANFETLKANWYGDEDRELKCQFTLVSATTFKEKFAQITIDGWQVDGENNAALKLGAIADKQHVILDIDNQPEGALGDKSRWLSDDIQLQLQVMLKFWLNRLATEFQFDLLNE